MRQKRNLRRSHIVGDFSNLDGHLSSRPESLAPFLLTTFLFIFIFQLKNHKKKKNKKKKQTKIRFHIEFIIQRRPSHVVVILFCFFMSENYFSLLSSLIFFSSKIYMPAPFLLLIYITRAFKSLERKRDKKKTRWPCVCSMRREGAMPQSNYSIVCNLKIIKV